MNLLFNIASLFILVTQFTLTVGTSYSTLQDTSLCAFIAATNVESLFTDWSCTPSGTVTTNPCTTFWSKVTCTSNTYIVELDLGAQPMIGTVPDALGSLSTVTFLGLYYTSLHGLSNSLRILD